MAINTTNLATGLLILGGIAGAGYYLSTGGNDKGTQAGKRTGVLKTGGNIPSVTGGGRSQGKGITINFPELPQPQTQSAFELPRNFQRITGQRDRSSSSSSGGSAMTGSEIAEWQETKPEPSPSGLLERMRSSPAYQYKSGQSPAPPSVKSGELYGDVDRSLKTENKKKKQGTATGGFKVWV